MSASAHNGQPTAISAVQFMLEQLSEVAEHPKGVAAFFYVHRAFGRRGDPWACPLARHLRRRAGTQTDVCNIMVYKDVVSWEHPDHARGVKHMVTLPPALARFVRQFDAEYYPMLDVAIKRRPRSAPA